VSALPPQEAQGRAGRRGVVTARSDMSAAGTRLLDLLTVSEAAARLGCSAKMVRRLADADPPLLERVRFGVLVRITPESVAAYKRHTDNQEVSPDV
jgi:excisionase family DNA binding protein